MPAKAKDESKDQEQKFVGGDMPDLSTATRRHEERSNLREVEWGSEDLKAARKSGNNARLPLGIKIKSPYGESPVEIPRPPF